MGFLWRDSFSIGNAVIDSEHQQLFKLAQAFFDANDRLQQADCAMQLMDSTRQHFDHEERWMREISYPGMSEHVQQHNRLVQQFNDVAETIALGTLDRSTLKSFLSAWLIGHMVTFDAKLSTYLQQDEEKRPATDLQAR